jgi:hypothetical protein
MNSWLRRVLLVWLCLYGVTAAAEVRVFTLVTPHPEQLVDGLRSLYGDKIQVDLVQQRLVVIGTSKQLDEIDSMLAQLDRAPAPLRLIVRERPPPTASEGGTFSTDRDAFTLDTVEGALVTLQYDQVVQQPTVSRFGHGWVVRIENEPTPVSALMLQIQLQGKRSLQVLVSYSKEQNQRRQVFGNTALGELDTWIPLLPQSGAENSDDGTISSGPKPGSQLYLRVERMRPPEASSSRR